jgi:predicted TIM-barrel fold metal-dependent hydrolase
VELLPRCQQLSRGGRKGSIELLILMFIFGLIMTSLSSDFLTQRPPPTKLRDVGSIESLRAQMKLHGVDGALVVQPINHEYDHSYIEHGIQLYPHLFKGMLLFNPTVLSESEAISQIDRLRASGFVGIRFNPYLWPEGSTMSQENGIGLAVYRYCGSISMPVGIMCFQGLDQHYSDILKLLTLSPSTTMVLDHFGFTRFATETGDPNCISQSRQDDMFEKLLSLSQFPQVYVKISALFRLNDQTVDYARLRNERFLPLLSRFGANRLMFGTDFPYVLEKDEAGHLESYGSTVETIVSWCSTPDEATFIMGGTAEHLFGTWGST